MKKNIFNFYFLFITEVRKISKIKIKNISNLSLKYIIKFKKQKNKFNFLQIFFLKKSLIFNFEKFYLI